MKQLYKHLKTAADKLDAQAELLDKVAEALDAAEASVKTAEAKAEKAVADAEAKLSKTANAKEASKAELAPLAKTAADAIRDVGLLSSNEQADQFAAQILDHKQALGKLAQLSKYVGIPKRASVVVDTQGSKPETADERWDAKARAALNSLHLEG